ncbi:hypothetical protein VSDG_05046 [Cytospora chrysosperma]|uniref:cyclin-dependent kinase n=1 Tax=Cytospora chrysosperma TaxID=252740 RepID=A0A423VYT4_CYTCH|nr:hypothetical protein VSDG_05046 [Valsa sordida]
MSAIQSYLASYQLLGKLGEGGYATVYKGCNRETGAVVALKEIRLGADEGIPPTAIREIALMKQLRHENILPLHDVIYSDNKLVLVSQFMDMDLKKYMIVHGGPNGQLSGDLQTLNYSSDVVTLWYRPPDVLLGNDMYSTSIDMWSVGCIVAEMLAGDALFPGATNEDQLRRIFAVLGTPTELSWPGISRFHRYNPAAWPMYAAQDLAMVVPQADRMAVDLLRRLLRMRPELRISAADGLWHYWFLEARSTS